MSPIRLLLIIFILITSSIIIYFLLYKRNINKKLQEQSYNADFDNEKKYKRMPDFHVVAIVIVIVMILSSLSTANSRINSLNDNVTNLHMLLDEVDELRDEVKELNDLLAYNNSIINDFEVKFGKLNTEDNTAEIFFKITLKNKLKDARYMIKINDNVVTLKEGKNECVEGSMNLNIFGEYRKMFFICKKSDGEKTIERIDADNSIFEDSYPLLTDDEATLYEQYMLQVYANSNSVEKSIFKKEQTISTELEIEKGDCVENNTEITSAKYVTKADGKIIEEKKVEDTKQSIYKHSQIVDTKKYKDIDCYLEIADNRGYVYKYYYFMQRDGDESDDYLDNYMEIYDSNNNLLIESEH